jgi:ribonuclease HI
VARRLLYTDGGSLGNGRVDQRARMAVYDAELGQVVVDQELGALTNNEAEYRAIEAALDYASANAARGVEIRSDSLLCVSQIKGEWKVKEERLRPAVERCRRKLAALGGTITWVRRDRNPAGRHLENLDPLGIALPAVRHGARAEADRPPRAAVVPELRLDALPRSEGRGRGGARGRRPDRALPAGDRTGARQVEPAGRVRRPR